MKGLSDEIRLALDTVIEGLQYDFLIELLEEDKMKRIMDSKVTSFNSAKKMLDRWMNSPNSPSNDTIKAYIEKLILSGDKALFFLRNALKTSIKFDEISPEKHDAAIKAKPLILEAILDLDSSINELRVKIDNDDLSLKEVEFVLGYPEKFAKGEFFNNLEYNKDVLKNGDVKICPFGTEGKRIELDGLGIILPKQPKKSEILFHNLPKKDQYWRRPELPEFSPDNAEYYSDFIKEEFRRRVEGIWFMNNGEAVYLTGNQYFALTYFRMMDDGDFMNFRYAQLNMFYHMEACIKDPRCLGQLFGKSRRTGFTYCVLAILLNWCTSRRNGKYGMMSKTGVDGEEAFMKISYAFQNLPFWFRPIVQGKIESTSHLFFSAPADNSKAAKKAKSGNINDYLNTMLDWRNTTNGSYDSIKLAGYLLDECFEPTTKILTPEGFKEIRHIKVGDFVVDSKGVERRVSNRVMGVTDMYEVVQPYGKNYVVTGNHKMYVNYGSDNKCSKNVFMSPIEYMSLPEHRKRYVRRVVCSGFEYSEKELEIDPYILGCWLGDGVSADTSFVINREDDPEILQAVSEYAEELGMTLGFYQNSNKCHTVRLSDPSIKCANQTTGTVHKFKKKLKDLNLFKNKHIPEVYMKSSREQRLQLLAGIIDTDGHKSVKRDNGFRINMSRKDLILQIQTLCKELGIDVSNIDERYTNFGTKSYSVSISDYAGEIPCKVKRKKPTPTKRVNRRGRMYVQPKGVGEYVGITIEADNDEDRLLVLEDYTLSKNCFKFERPNSIIVHLAMITPTMMPNNGTPVGKMFAGSTMGAHAKGGSEGIELIKSSQLIDRDPITGKTPTGLYFYFLPAQENMEDFTDIYGFCHKVKPKTKTYNVKGFEITMGSIDFLIATEDQKRAQSDIAYNEWVRTYPRTVQHMMRDEAGNCVFNLNKLTEQLEFNETLSEEDKYVVGNFEWKDEDDGDVVFYPNPKGRFKVAWLPSVADGTEHLANNVEERNGRFYPLNKNCVRFGCDPFSLKSTHGQGSKGAIHGKTVMMPDGGAPSNKFVVEYIARPPDETIFFEDVIKVIRYYGAPILVESNRIDLLRHMRNRGYRPFSMNRLDRPEAKLNENEKEYGGQPMSGKDILDSHMNGIGGWIEKYVGKYNGDDDVREYGEIGEIPFDETLRDWSKFNPDDRTKYDATISSGLAIMACQTEKYKGKKKGRVRKSVTFVKKYDNKGQIGSILRR